jgi:ABC-type glutathione transport system ATPase component
VFDEAVGALDALGQAQALNLIRELQVERGFGAPFNSRALAAVRYFSRRARTLVRQAGA